MVRIVFSNNSSKNTTKFPFKKSAVVSSSSKLVSFKGLGSKNDDEDLIGWHSSIIKTQLAKGLEVKTLPDVLRKLFESIPKTEIHLHLSGSTPRSLIREIYSTTPQDDGKILTPDQIDKKMACIKDEYKDLNDFLYNGYYVVAWTVQTPEQFKKAAEEICLEAARENAKYLEIRTSLIKKDTDPQEILKAVADGIEQARVKLLKEGYKEVPPGFKQIGKIIVLAQRHKSGKESLLHAQEAVKGRDIGLPVVGFDLGGSEENYPVVLHKEAIKYAREHGLKVTVHAGETNKSSFLDPLREKDPLLAKQKNESDLKEFKDDLIKMLGTNYLEEVERKNKTGQALISFTPYDSMECALDCGADRLGHAIHVMDNTPDADNIRNKMKQNLIPIECAPKSNVQINNVESYESHPVKNMLDAGLNVSINTDNRTMTSTDGTNEFAQLYLHGLIKSWNDIKKLTLNGVQSVFLPNNEKQALVKDFKTDFDKIENDPLFMDAINKYLTPTISFLGTKIQAILNNKAA